MKTVRTMSTGKNKPAKKKGVVQSREETRLANEQKILHAAEEIFANTGFAGATTSAIARKAGLPTWSP